MTALLDKVAEVFGFKRHPFRSVSEIDGVPVELIWIPVSHLFVDRKYQRKAHHRIIRRIVQKFLMRALGVIIVNGRADGVLVIVDGQHRVEAVRKKYGNDYEVPCLVFWGESVKEEAEQFHGINNNRHNPNALAGQKAGSVGEVPEVVEITRIIEAHGFRFEHDKKQTTSPEEIICYGTLQTMYERGGAAHLDEVCALVKALWPDDASMRKQVVFQGVDSFLRLVKNDPNYNREHLIRRVRECPAALYEDKLDQNAPRRQRLAVGHMFTLLDLYNHRLSKAKKLHDPRNPL